MPLVIDASVTAAWCFNDEDSDQANAAQDEMLSTETLAPAIWWYEVRNIVLIGERRGRLTSVDTEAFLSKLQRFPISLDREHDSDMILALARTHRLTAYDAAYLETAMRHGAMLATLDKSLASAAERQGVALFTA